MYFAFVVLQRQNGDMIDNSQSDGIFCRCVACGAISVTADENSD